MDHLTLHCDLNALQFVVAHHRWAIVMLVARKRLYVPMVMQMSQSAVHHFLHSAEKDRIKKNKTINLN